MSKVPEQKLISTLSSWSISPFPVNRGSLVNISAIMQPTDHISTAVEYFFAPRRSSGALQCKSNTR
jgi:hypothetical protein